MKNCQIIKDSLGIDIGVFIPINDYENHLKTMKRIMVEVQMLRDIVLYDQVKKEDTGERIALENYMKERNIRLD